VILLKKKIPLVEMKSLHFGFSFFFFAEILPVEKTRLGRETE
jgi:hypothetical protein